MFLKPRLGDFNQDLSECQHWNVRHVLFFAPEELKKLLPVKPFLEVSKRQTGPFNTMATKKNGVQVWHGNIDHYFVSVQLLINSLGVQSCHSHHGWTKLQERTMALKTVDAPWVQPRKPGRNTSQYRGVLILKFWCPKHEVTFLPTHVQNSSDALFWLYTNHDCITNSIYCILFIICPCHYRFGITVYTLHVTPKFTKHISIHMHKHSQYSIFIH